MTLRKSSILRQAAFRLFISLGLFVVLVGVSTALLYRVALNKAAAERADDLRDFYSTRLMQMEREWELGSRDVRARIEYTRMLEHAEDSAQHFQAYMTIQGGARRYSYLVIQNRKKQVLFAFGRDKEGIAAAVAQGRAGEGWFLEPSSQALYRVFEEQIWLGTDGNGRALFFYPLDNALLLQMTMPGTILTVLYQGRRAASSEGLSRLEVMGGFSGSSARHETRVLPWSGMDSDPVRLEIQSPVKGLFSAAQLVSGASAIPLLDALVLWFVLGTWLLFNARRIKTLGEAVREFYAHQALTPQLGKQIDSARQGRGDEIDEVASALETLAQQTEQRERERLAEDAERRLWARVFEGSNDAIIITDARHRVVAVNPAFERAMGYRSDEVLGHDPHELMASGQHDEAYYQAAWRLIDAQGYWQGEIWDRIKSGEILPKLLSISAIRDPSGVVSNYVGIYADLTEKKRSEAQLQQYREQLEKLVQERTRELESTQQALLKQEKLATLGQLISTVSHELRNPLSAMRPSLYVLRRKMPDKDERTQQAIERIERSIGRCDHIIDELMEFAREHRLVRETVALDAWLGSVLHAQPIPEGVKVQFEPGVAELTMAIDTARMQRAVLNVYENACQALAERQNKDGERFQPWIRVSTRHGAAGEIEIEIADNGDGMSETVLERIFEPLFSTRGFGVGLGMSLARQVMVQHGGDIRVVSQQGQGARVTLYFCASATQEELEK